MAKKLAAMINAQDEGPLQFAVSSSDDKVLVRFGGPVAWLTMTPEKAVAFGEALISRARVVARKHGKTLTVSIG
jgi:hypothetical protein